MPVCDACRDVFYTPSFSGLCLYCAIKLRPAMHNAKALRGTPCTGGEPALSRDSVRAWLEENTIPGRTYAEATPDTRLKAVLASLLGMGYARRARNPKLWHVLRTNGVRRGRVGKRRVLLFQYAGTKRPSAVTLKPDVQGV